MKKKLNRVLLVDDDEDCNYFHKRLLTKMNVTDNVEIANNGQEAIDFLVSEIEGKHPKPDIIFLDINMPVMNGWEFLEAYKKLDNSQKGKLVIVMLSTSLNPDDKTKALGNDLVNDFENKYLNEESLTKILKKNFPIHF
ncbi:MAG TPA: response regulator [Fulvivirga sp.]|nr:response regulator [Fulvivirga sp.]